MFEKILAGRRPPIVETTRKHEMRILSIAGVEGIAVGQEKGTEIIRVFVPKKTKIIERAIPSKLDGYTVRLEVTGGFHAI